MYGGHGQISQPWGFIPRAERCLGTHPWVGSRVSAITSNEHKRFIKSGMAPCGKNTSSPLNRGVDSVLRTGHSRIGKEGLVQITVTIVMVGDNRYGWLRQ